MPTTMAQMNPKETQTAAMFSLDVQSRVDVRFMTIPYMNGEVR
jgi:hypothetical protein